jgi:hypothetical protein
MITNQPQTVTCYTDRYTVLPTQFVWRSMRQKNGTWKTQAKKWERSRRHTTLHVATNCGVMSFSRAKTTHQVNESGLFVSKVFVSWRWLCSGMLCSLPGSVVDSGRRFRGVYCISYQGYQPDGDSKFLWNVGHYLPDYVAQKTATSILVAMRILNLTSYQLYELTFSFRRHKLHCLLFYKGVFSSIFSTHFIKLHSVLSLRLQIIWCCNIVKSEARPTCNKVFDDGIWRVITTNMKAEMRYDPEPVSSTSPVHSLLPWYSS